LPGREGEAWKTEIDKEEDMQRGRQGGFSSRLRDDECTSYAPVQDE